MKFKDKMRFGGGYIFKVNPGHKHTTLNYFNSKHKDSIEISKKQQRRKQSYDGSKHGKD